MLIKEKIYQEIESMPEEYAGEILDFIEFIKTKYIEGKNDTALLSESSLKKDWMLPEEEKAWEDL